MRSAVQRFAYQHCACGDEDFKSESKAKYESLTKATGGSFLLVPSHEDVKRVAPFVKQLLLPNLEREINATEKKIDYYRQITKKTSGRRDNGALQLLPFTKELGLNGVKEEDRLRRNYVILRKGDYPEGYQLFPTDAEATEVEKKRTQQNSTKQRRAKKTGQTGTNKSRTNKKNKNKKHKRLKLKKQKLHCSGNVCIRRYEL